MRLITLPLRSGSVEVDPNRVLCNRVTLPFDSDSEFVKLWAVFTNSGFVGAAWAESGSEMDETINALVHSGFLDKSLVDRGDTIRVERVLIESDLKLSCMFAYAKGAEFFDLGEY